jgi:hypothetical protein
MTMTQPAQGPAPAGLDSPRARGVHAPKVKVIGMRSRGVVSQPEDRHRVREGGTPFLLERDICLVDNVDDVDWQFKWERRSYKVVAGQVGATVPFPALVNALGDPRSVPGEQTKFRTEDGQAGLILTRYESLATLFARYAVENENIGDLVEFAPKVIVRHMETGEVITFPVQDPDCSPWPVPQHAAPGREPSGDKARMVALEDENRRITQELAEMRDLISNRLAPPAQAPAADQTVQPGTGPIGFDPAAALAGDPGAAMGGATVDQGPATTFE